MYQPMNGPAAGTKGNIIMCHVANALLDFLRLKNYTDFIITLLTKCIFSYILDSDFFILFQSTPFYSSYHSPPSLFSPLFPIFLFLSLSPSLHFPFTLLSPSSSPPTSPSTPLLSPHIPFPFPPIPFAFHPPSLPSLCFSSMPPPSLPQPLPGQYNPVMMIGNNTMYQPGMIGMVPPGAGIFQPNGTILAQVCMTI